MLLSKAVVLVAVLAGALFAGPRFVGADDGGGPLTQLDGEAGCMSNDGADGRARGRALDGPSDLAVSRDGRSVYVASQNSNAVAVFSRDRETGVLTQLDGEAAA